MSEQAEQQTQLFQPDSHIPNDPDALLTERQAALLLNVSVRTMQNWRVRGGGPEFRRLGTKAIRYHRRTLLEWTEVETLENTSQGDAS